MEVSVSAGDGLERRMTVQIPEEQIGPEVDKRLQSLQRTARLDGFRPGKVPIKVLRKKYSQGVRHEVLTGLVEATYSRALAQEGLKPAGAPAIEDLRDEQGAGCSYTAKFEVYPEIEIPDPSGFELVRETAEVTEADVDNMLETLRAQRVVWDDVDRPAAEGDQVVADFTGKMDGEPLEGAAGTDVPVEIGSGRLIDGFETGLVGLKAGDTRTLDLTFPENYHAEKLAGRPVSFDVEVKKVQEKRLPELDEAFVRSFGIESGRVEDLRADVRANMERELREALLNRAKGKVIEALLAAGTPEVPQVMVRAEAERLAGGAGAAAQGGQAPDPAMFLGEAEHRVAVALLMSEIVNTKDIQVDRDRVRQQVEEIASSYEDAQQVVDWYYSDPQRLREVESLVMENQVVEWVLERAQVTEEQRSFDDIMKPGQTRS